MKIKYSVFLTEKIGYPGKADTNLLIKESAKRFPTYAFEPHELFIENGKVKASAHKVSVKKNGELSGDKKIKIIELTNNCVVTIRLNPPFDSRYLSAMYMLAEIEGNSYVANNPSSIINMPEKFIPAELQKFTPPTIISQDEKQITEFHTKHKDIVIKPLYGFGGFGVFRLKSGTKNAKSEIRKAIKKYNEPVIAQKYIPEVTKGDKRISLIDGEIAGYFLRVPPKGQLQAAVIQGGSFVKTTMTKREKDISKILKPILKQNDIFLCGFDMIGDYLTEINVTCPAHFYCYNELYRKDRGFVPSERLYWDRLEKKLKTL